MAEWTPALLLLSAWCARVCLAEETPHLCSIFTNFPGSHSSKTLNLHVVISMKLLEHLKQMAVIKEEMGSL